MTQKTIQNCKQVLLLIILLSSVQLFSQNHIDPKKEFLEVSYHAVFDMDVDYVLQKVPKQYRKKVEPFVKQELENGIEMDFLLLTNGEKSKFSYIEKLENMQGQASFVKRKMIEQEFRGSIFKNFELLNSLKEQPLMDKTYLISDSLINYNWQTTRDTLMVNGYACRKAKSYAIDSTEITAYYSPKISIKDGPLYSYGLSGLILKFVYRTSDGYSYSFTADEITVKKINPDKISPPKKYDIITKNELNEKVIEIKRKLKAMQGKGVDTSE